MNPNKNSQETLTDPYVHYGRAEHDINFVTNSTLLSSYQDGKVRMNLESFRFIADKMVKMSNAVKRLIDLESNVRHGVGEYSSLTKEQRKVQSDALFDVLYGGIHD